MNPERSHGCAARSSAGGWGGHQGEQSTADASTLLWCLVTSEDAPAARTVVSSAVPDNLGKGWQWLGSAS